MEHVSQVGEMRSRLAAETAERAQLITALLPAAQDAAVYDLKEMLNRYKEVVMLNEELLTGCFIRRATQEQAVTSLKSLHTILQQAARLRVYCSNEITILIKLHKIVTSQNINFICQNALLKLFPITEYKVGKYSKAVVAASRKAVQNNNIEALFKIIQVGDS
ncbi:unnamed protein product [Arctia plantaginis]|uniref:Uncharacterized protein n=1 Tax=Arctia plantaginis TaxID=874455 RepID=A0A8S1BFY0_ARCPL|nr:unnamed protein product [Arctia plantaginis]